MTTLQRAALASLPLTEATVQDFFDGTRSGTAEQCLRALCVSHERLRAELQGAEALLYGDAGKKDAPLADDLVSRMVKDALFAQGHGEPLPWCFTADLCCHVLALASEVEALRAQRVRWREAIRGAIQSIRRGGVTAPIAALEKLLGESDV